MSETLHKHKIDVTLFSFCVRERTLIIRSEGRPSIVANACCRSCALNLMIVFSKTPCLRPLPTSSWPKCCEYRCCDRPEVRPMTPCYPGAKQVWHRLDAQEGASLAEMAQSMLRLHDLIPPILFSCPAIFRGSDCLCDTPRVSRNRLLPACCSDVYTCNERFRVLDGTSMLVLPGHDTREMSRWSPRPMPKAEMTSSMALVPVESEVLGLSRILRPSRTSRSCLACWLAN